jgi:membrane protein
MTERRRRERAVNVALAARRALGRMGQGGREFLFRLWERLGQDDVFFLAGGIAFNILFAAVPFLLMLIGVFGFVLDRVVDDPQKAAVDYVISILPPSQTVVRVTRRLVGDVVEGRTGFSVLGVLLFVWSSTRLFGALRSVLKEIFDLPEERGIIEGKLFDLQMVVVAGSLFVANTGITVVLEAAQNFGARWLGISDRPEVQAAQRLWGQMVAFGFIFVMFLIIYRYLPKRRIPWRIALVGAAFAATAWEMLKGLFAWYVVNAVTLNATYGTLVAPIVLVLWVYYSSVVFVLGGEIAQVYDLLRVRRSQRELLE